MLIEHLVAKRTVAVSCGADHTLAVTGDGEVYSWGSNSKSQLGRNTGTQKSCAVPNLVEFDHKLMIVKVSGGAKFSAFVD